MKPRKQLLSLFRAKYDDLLPNYPQIGPFEAGRLSTSGGTVIYDFGGGINSANADKILKQSGGAVREFCQDNPTNNVASDDAELVESVTCQYSRLAQ